MTLGHPQNLVNCGGDFCPALLLIRQPLTSGGGELIHAGTLARFFLDPVALDPTLVLESMERRVKRTLLDAENVAGRFDDRGQDGVTMHWFAAGEDFEDKKVKRS